MWDQSYKLQNNNALFFLETSLVYLGTSPDNIGKTSFTSKRGHSGGSNLGLSLRFGVCQTLSKKVMEAIFFHFQQPLAASNDLGGL